MQAQAQAQEAPGCSECPCITIGCSQIAKPVEESTWLSALGHEYFHLHCNFCRAPWFHHVPLSDALPPGSLNQRRWSWGPLTSGP